VKFKRLAIEIQDGYYENPYHNSTHGCDVVQMTYLLLSIGRLENILMISPLSQICLYVASAGHDYKHPGMNNKFLV